MSEEQEQEASPAERLFALEGAPTQDDVDVWKKLHGDVFVSTLSPTEIFIFRSLNRAEFREAQELQAQRMQAGLAVHQFDEEEATVKSCVLFASVDLLEKAGTVPTLLEQLLVNSNFIPPQVAMSLVAKL